MATITIPGMFLTGTHAARPAATAVGTGTIYSCTTDSLVYQSDGATWSTWATLGTSSTTVATDAIWDTAGDLAVGTGANTAAKLVAGATSGHVLTSNGSGVAPSWQAGASGSVATDTIWDAAGDLALGTGANTAAKLVIGTNGYVLTSNGTTAAWAAASGSADDPIADIFGTPDTAYEFDAALSGWTTMGTATASDADSTVPGHYYVYKAATASTDHTGIYRATGSFPQTFITKVSDVSITGADYSRLGAFFVAEASPGVMEGIYATHNSDWTIAHERFTNPTTYSASVGTNIPTKTVSVPIYYGILVNSSTDVDFWYSFGGRIWRKRTDARNPSITVGSFGIAVNPENVTHGSAAAFDYVRIWNSAKTFPGF